MKKYYFICGLPRSGSTLLAGILNQSNFSYASMSTSLLSAFANIQFNKQSTIINVNEEQAANIYLKTIEGYYSFVNKPIVFDTNRGWPRFIGLLPRLFPYTKLIVCLRDVPSILNSFENHYLSKNIAPSYISSDGCFNPWKRFEDWLNAMIIDSYETCEYLYRSPELSKHCIFVDYDELISDPSKILKVLHEELELPDYRYDFNNVNHSFEKVDSQYSNENLHKVYPAVGKTPTKWLLPDYVVEKYTRNWFWKGE